MQAQRDSTIDVAKGFGILLVVLGHNQLVIHEKGESFRLIYSFHMILFLSGVFLTRSGVWSKLLRSRIDSLLKPYFVVLGAIGIAKLMKTAVTSGQLHSGHLEHFSGVLYGTGSTLGLIPMWYLPHLFLGLLCAFAIIRLARAWGRTALAASAICLVFAGALGVDLFWSTEPVRIAGLELPRLLGLPWSIDLLPLTTGAILLGHLLADQVRNFRFRPLWLGLSTFTFVGLHAHFDEIIDLNMRVYGSFIVATLQAVVGIYLSLGIARLFSTMVVVGPLLAYVGSGTLFILMFHVVFQGRSFAWLLGWSGDRWIAGTISFCLGVAIPLCLWELAKRQKLLGMLLLTTPRESSAALASEKSR